MFSRLMAPPRSQPNSWIWSNLPTKKKSRQNYELLGPTATWLKSQALMVKSFCFISYLLPSSMVDFVQHGRFKREGKDPPTNKCTHTWHGYPITDEPRAEEGGGVLALKFTFINENTKTKNLEKHIC